MLSLKLLASLNYHCRFFIMMSLCVGELVECEGEDRNPHGAHVIAVLLNSPPFQTSASVTFVWFYLYCICINSQ